MKTSEFTTYFFQDLDGCLADFDKKVKELTGKTSNQLGHKMWGQISDQKIEPGTPHHEILTLLYREQPLTKDLAQRTKAIRQLENLELLDTKTMMVTDVGKAALAGLDTGEEYAHVVDFYNSLDKLPDADELWAYIARYDPVILTGLPRGNWAEPQKRKWVAREIGPHVKVITCMAKDKAKYAMEHMGTDNLNGAILIDDRPQHQAVWEDAGGRWITHTSAKDTIAQLKALNL